MLAARKVKSDGRAELVLLKVTVTGSNVPGVNGGMFCVAFALVAPALNVSDCNPVPAFTWSTVTELPVVLTPNETIPPGNKSPSVTVPLQVNDTGGGVGIGVGVGVVIGELIKVTSVTPSMIPNGPLNTVVREPGANDGSVLVPDVMPETNVPAAALSVMVTVEP